MKFLVVLAVFVAAAAAAPADSDATIISQVNEPNTGSGDYQSGFETSNGIKAEEQGQLVNVGTDNVMLIKRGAFKYTGLDGLEYLLTYIADQNGFQPQAAHLPKPVVA